MHDFARLLVVAGLCLAAVGLVLYLLPVAPPLGRLPGDIRIERPGFRLYLPITTCALVSVVGTAILWLLGRWR